MQTSIQALVVAPYPGLKNMVQSLESAMPDIRVHAIVADMDVALDSVRKLNLSDYDVVISRGGTGELIARTYGIQVINIGVYSYDIMRAIELSRGFSGKSAIIGYRNITDGAASLVSVLNDKSVGVFTIEHKSDLIPLLTKLSEQGYRNIIGDVITSETAAASGMNSILITSGIESVKAAFDEARRLYFRLKDYKAYSGMLETAIAESDARAVVYDRQGNLRFDSLNNAFSDLDNLNAHLETVFEHGSIQLLLPDESAQWCVSGRKLEYAGDVYAAFYVFALPVAKKEHPWLSVINGFSNDASPIHAFRCYRIHLEECLPRVEEFNRLDVPCTIIGEAGTGKDYIASAIHQTSVLQAAAMICLDCEIAGEHDLTPLTDMVDKLCGPERRCTLYVQKLWMLSIRQQCRLAELINGDLQGRVRLISSLRTNPSNMLSSGALCEAMFSCIGMHRIYVPSLRDRPENMRELTSQFIIEANLQYGKQVVALEQADVDLLNSFKWPGNLSQLRRVMHDLVLFCALERIDQNAIRAALARESALDAYTGEPVLDTTKTLDELTDSYIKLVVNEEGGKLTSAAKRLGISRSTLWRRINQL